MQDMTLHREANCLSRFDRLPLGREVLKIVAVLAAVSVVEAFDLGLIGQTVLVLKQLWNLSPQDTGLLGTCSTLGVVLGTFSCGFLSDRYGRKRVLMWATFIFTLFTLAGPLVENFSWVVSMRFLSGLGAGAVFPIPYLYISELVGSKHRGVVFAYCNSILVMSYVIPSTFGAWAVANFPLETAWKLPFIVGGLPVFMVLVIWKCMPESPRWLMKHGRADEAIALVERLERSAGTTPDPNYTDPNIVAALSESRKPGAVQANWRLIFKPPYLSRTIVSWSMYTAGLIFWYVVMVYAPSILKSKGFQMSSSVLMGGLMMAIGGVAGIVCGHFIDKYGRKPLYAIFAGAAAVCSACLAMLDSLGVWVAVGAALAFFGNGIFAICKLYIAEQYPTSLRGTGAGLGEATSRILGGVLATYYIAFILAHGGQSAVFWFLGAAYAVAIVLMLIWGQETAGKSVDATGGTGSGTVTTEEAGGTSKVATGSGTTAQASASSPACSQ